MEIIPAYLLGALVMATEDFNDKVDPEFGILAIVQAVQEMLQLIQLHFQTCLVQLFVGSPAIHRETVVWKNDLMSRVEEGVCDLMERLVDGFVLYNAVA